jgi:hypothetical protein
MDSKVFANNIIAILGHPIPITHYAALRFAFMRTPFMPVDLKTSIHSIRRSVIDGESVIVFDDPNKCRGSNCVFCQYDQYGIIGYHTMRLRY